VERSVSDFEWLHNNLLAEFPELTIIPFNPFSGAAGIKMLLEFIRMTPQIQRSRFLAIFLKCKNSITLNRKKKREYQIPGAISRISSKVGSLIGGIFTKNSIPLNQKIAGDNRAKERNSFVFEEDQREYHIFHKELETLNKLMRTKIKSATDILTDIQISLSDVVKKSNSLACILSEIGEGYSGLESCPSYKKLCFDPPLSSIYDRLKTVVFNWGNLINHQQKQLCSFLEPCFFNIGSVQSDILSV